MFDAMNNILSVFVIVSVCIVATTLLISVPVYATTVPLGYSDDDYDASVEVPPLLEYEGSQMTITTATLGTFPFLELSVSFDDDAVTADTRLEILLSDMVFDPIFDINADFQILTETDFHENFEISQRNLIISELPVGIETVEIFVAKETTIDDVDDTVVDDTVVDDTVVDDTVVDDTMTEDIIDDTFAENNFVSDEVSSDTIPIPDLDTVDNSDEDLPTSDIIAVQPFDTSKCGPGTVLVDDTCVLESDAPTDTSKCGPGTVLVDDTCVLESDAPTDTSKCGPGTVLVDDTCVLESDAPTDTSKCGPGTVLVDDTCVLELSDSTSVVNDDESETIPAVSTAKVSGRELVTGVIAGFVIAGFVGVILALMHRASRRKSSPKTSL